jgi:hypothetical protein
MEKLAVMGDCSGVSGNEDIAEEAAED